MHEYPSDKRFQQTFQGEAITSEYDFDSDDVNDAYMRNVACIVTRTFDLSVAQLSPLELIIPGRALQVFDYVTTDVTKAPVATALVTGAFNDPGTDKFSLRYRRGFNGTYSRVYLTWLAQANTSMEMWFLKSTRNPWFYG